MGWALQPTDSPMDWALEPIDGSYLPAGVEARLFAGQVRLSVVNLVLRADRCV